MKQRASLRIRVTIVSTVVVALALAAAGVAIDAALRSSQLQAVDASLETRAGDIESLLEASALPSDLDVGTGDVIQVIDAEGNIVAASRNATSEPLFAQPEVGVFTVRIEQLDSEDYRLLIENDRRSGSTVIVGRALEQVDAVGADTRNAFLLALALLTFFVGCVVWAVIGRALQPVEEMRSEAADIGGSELHRRVPSPGTNDEIGQLASTMNEMLDRIEASSAAQARFVSDASHELRSPISVIRHQLEIALREGSPEALQLAASEVLDENLRMQRLVDDLLLLAQEDSAYNHQQVVSPLVDLDDIVLEEARLSRPTAKIDTSQVSAGQVRCNPDHLVQVVRNLLDNALRHAKSAVALTVEGQGPFVILHVDDNGSGVDPSDRERVFERFARTDGARARHGGGTGLGLAIASDLVHRYGGDIAVSESPTLGGARFTVTLPNARA